MNTAFLGWLIATLHLVALALGLGSLRARAHRLRGRLDGPGIAGVLSADRWWQVAIVLWISTGLVRLLASLDKPREYYLHNNPLFHIKMTLLVIVLGLEAWPLITFLGWRSRLIRAEPVPTANARLLARLSDVQMTLVILMLCAATALARGLRL